MAFETSETSRSPTIRAQLLASKPPQLSVLSPRVLRVLMDTGIGTSEFSAAVGADANIVGRLISLANSAWSSPTRPISSLDEVVLRLGIDTARTAAIAVAIQGSFSIRKSTRFSNERYWLGSIVTAQLSEALADELRLDAGSARAGGLLHSIGLLWLVDRYPEEVDRALAEFEENPDMEIDAWLEAHCGIGYREAGELMLRAWGVPETIIAPSGARSPDGMQAPEPLHQVIGAAARLSSQLLRDVEPNDWAAGDICVGADVIQRIMGEQLDRLDALTRMAADICAA